MRPHKKIILFGGSFDPIHTGHLRVAHYTLGELDANKLIFIPARRSPHKTDSPTPGQHRFAMIAKAIDGVDGFSVSDCELSRPEPSYTLDTIRFFRCQLGSDAVLHWLIGADQLTDLEKWYCVGDLLKECRVSVMIRAGYPPPDFSRFADVFSPEIISRLEGDIVRTPQIDLSSTDIRRQLSSGRVPPNALPPAVLAYITEHCLYGFGCTK
ncbi:MAG: nicotinate (nicotinamide) nucleotide adenylyltransferase [Planctomycetes bacterium]|nr:nicotinate (nicotinamide) nucleotide adenylyltransferase [Planctomycetota bacterium]